MAETFEYALSRIVWYNGHAAWLMDMAEELESPNGNYYGCPIDANFWGTEPHVIWMILVGMFGDWGTSIRGGWIEDKAGAAKFIRDICKDDMENMEKTESGWRYKDGEG